MQNTIYGEREKHYINQYENTKRNEKTSILSVFSFLGCQNAERHEKQYIWKNMTTLPKNVDFECFSHCKGTVRQNECKARYMGKKDYI